ncbi:MAG: hypothetical protein NTZ36_03595 [Candidatus Jorgensenbacteria bacterium]|nr:hypothetical protein [Candidatus Jorgensenbacteria bacterium]
MAKEQWEEEAIERFRTYLSQTRSFTYGVTDRDVVVNKQTGENFDYQLQNENGEKVAVEVFRLVENGEDLAKSRVWHSVVGFLRDAVKKKNLKGYLVYTPQFFVKKSEMKTYAEKMADVIEQGIKDNAGKEKFSHEGFQFHKIKSLDTISLSYSEGARSVDSRGTATNSFASKLPKKNKQVNVLDHERVIVVVNWAFFVDADSAIRALSSFDFEQFSNVDKIFFEGKQGEFELIFDRSAIEALKTRSEVTNSETLNLLIKYLRYQLADKNRGAFDFIKTVGSLSGNLDWLSDNGVKENLVHYGSDLCQQGLVEDAMWIVRMLQNDPNPNPTGANDIDDPKGEHNYHTQAIKNEDIRNITTVRGHLCWLMSRIIAQNKPEYYTEILNILTRYIAEENLYIRIQATYPLTEFVVRKKAVRNQDESPFIWDQTERSVVREIPLKMLRDNAQYPRVLEALLHIFDKFRDLNEAEAEEVLRVLIATDQDDVLHDLAALVPYFAIFRKNDFPDNGTFNPDVFVKILKDQIINGKSSMKSSMAWHFWKMLEQNTLPYEEIREYILLFWRNGYDSSVASTFGLIFEQLVRVAPEDAKDLFEKMIVLLKARLKDDPEEKHQAWINGTEEVLATLVTEPDRLLSLVTKLKDIWMIGGMYIGDIPSIFESYQHVPTKDKERVRSELKTMYDEMKGVNVHIQPVDWSK